MSTRKSAPVRIPASKPRNPLTVAARKRAAGKHGPDRKAVRKRLNQALRKLPDDPEA